MENILFASIGLGFIWLIWLQGYIMGRRARRNLKKTIIEQRIAIRWLRKNLDIIKTSIWADHTHPKIILKCLKRIVGRPND